MFKTTLEESEEKKTLLFIEETQKGVYAELALPLTELVRINLAEEPLEEVYFYSYA
ncbi:MAG: hypothetical protein WAW37_19545 [Syntrophobacteraceae bacterium]